MTFITGHPTHRIITDESRQIKTIPQYKKNYYMNIIKYMDEHIYFNYLKQTDPLFGFSFETQLPFYIRADVTLSIPIVIYQKNFPDDIDINPILLNMITENFDNGIFTITPDILEVREELFLQ